MGRLAYIPFSVTTTTTCDFVELTPADDKPIKLRGFLLGQTTELAEAQEEVLDVNVVRMTATVTSGSGGSAATYLYVDTGDQTVGTTGEINNTTIATTSGSTHSWPFPWQVRNVPLEFWFPDERFCPKAKQTEYLFLRLSSAPADSIALKGWICIEEE